MKNTLKYGYKLTLQERFKNWTNITNTNYDSKWFNKKLLQLCLNCVYTAAQYSQGVDHIEKSLITEVIFKLKRYVLSRTKLL